MLIETVGLQLFIDYCLRKVNGSLREAETSSVVCKAVKLKGKQRVQYRWLVSEVFRQEYYPTKNIFGCEYKADCV